MEETEEDRRRIIEKAMTSKGGYTRKQLALWGVSWPPVSGWKDKLIKEGFMPKL